MFLPVCLQVGLLVGWLVGFSAGSLKKSWRDFPETWIDDGSWLRMDAIEVREGDSGER